MYLRKELSIEDCFPKGQKRPQERQDPVAINIKYLGQQYAVFEKAPLTFKMSWVVLLITWVCL